MPGVLETNTLSDDQPVVLPEKGTLSDKGFAPKITLDVSISDFSCVDDSDGSSFTSRPNIVISVHELIKAIKHQDLFTLRYLLHNHENPIHPEVLIHKGSTPLHLASWCGFTEGLKELYLAGGNINIQDQVGATPLHFAVVGGHASTLQLLAQLGVNPNLVDDNGDSALHYAVRESRSTLVPLLLNIGVNPVLSNDDNETAYDMAREYREDAIATVLRPVSSRIRRAAPPPFIAII